MNQIIMLLFAAGAVLGGIDYMMGNKKGYGVKFEEAFMLLGPTALSMAGIICISPALAMVAGRLITPLCHLAGIDPAMAGGILAIDMGGYQLSVKLAADPALGNFSGIVIGAIFGCTVTFTLPIGMGMIDPADHGTFLKGMMIGMITMPAGFILGGLVCGFSPVLLLHQLSPILLLAFLLVIGLWKLPDKMLRFFHLFVRLLKALITFGLILGAFCYMLGLSFAWLTPLSDAMQVVASICIVMLGSLPATLFLQRALEKPLHALGTCLGLDDTSIAAILIGTVSVLPALTMVKDMSPKGKLAVCSWLVSAASLMGAHIAFTAGIAPDMTLSLIVAKLSGAFVALIVSLAGNRGQIS